MTTQAAIGYTSIFELWDASASPPEFVTLGEVTSISPPQFTSDTIDVTHMQSPGRKREYILGLISPGEASIEMNFVPGSASDELLRAVQTSGVATPAIITYPNGVTWSFDALVSGYEVSVPVDDKMAVTVTMQITSDLMTGLAS